MANKPKQKSVTAKSSGKVQKTAPVRVLDPVDEIERFLEAWVPLGWTRPLAQGRQFWNEFQARFELKPPNVDILDRDEEVVVRAEIPGVDKKDLDISINGRSITIKGKSSSRSEQEKDNYYRCEIASGAFSRTVALPEKVDGARAKMTFKDGLLELRLPKLERSQRQAVRVQ